MASNKNSYNQIGDYRLGKTLGQGAFGKVRCKDCLGKAPLMLITVVGINDITKDKVAIKILSKK